VFAVPGSLLSVCYFREARDSAKANISVMSQSLQDTSHNYAAVSIKLRPFVLFPSGSHLRITESKILTAVRKLY
jgi:hypothetical protein